MNDALLLIAAINPRERYEGPADVARTDRADRRFDVDFDRDISTGPARPHGVLMLPDRR